MPNNKLLFTVIYTTSVIYLLLVDLTLPGRYLFHQAVDNQTTYTCKATYTCINTEIDCKLNRSHKTYLFCKTDMRSSNKTREISFTQLVVDTKRGSSYIII
ncbi:hypothetical protein EB796_014529 [Bugula neritina]|uniref:Uncharacterized protein n=1 Tax=Bugula neritina TaxID=10212 RepID=A0A7J7JMS9_BUGNE|nr:hypothetical protein EB796_014529 [Bugula neritina]